MKEALRIRKMFGGNMRQVGYLAAADLLGLGIGSFLGVFWANKVNWKWTAILVLASILVFNQLSIWQLESITILLVLRFLSGLGQGSLLAIYSVHIAQTEKPEKIYLDKVDHIEHQYIHGTSFESILGQNGITDKQLLTQTLERALTINKSEKIEN